MLLLETESFALKCISYLWTTREPYSVQGPDSYVDFFCLFPGRDWVEPFPFPLSSLSVCSNHTLYDEIPFLSRDDLVVGDT